MGQAVKPMGKVLKIRPDVDSTPATLLGMMQGHSARIKKLIAVVVWDDDSYQVVNTKLQHSEHAFAAFMMEQALKKELEEEE